MSNVQVAVRARPLNTREIDLESPVAIAMRGKCTTLFKTVDGIAVGETRDDSKQFEYDYSYWSVDPKDKHFVTQEQVYNDLGKTVLESAFQGYNACVFAYGQTGSGKTYTMMGSEESPGLIPRICENLFARISTGSKRQVSYKVESSYMEIYNEKVRDLLHHSSGKSVQHNLKVREHPKEGPYVDDLSKHQVSDYKSIQKLIVLGNKHRATAATKMNDVSSRSHAIFTITFIQAAYSSDLPCETVSKIHLVDLAGSERVSATGAEGLRLKEGGNINKSLASLGNVIKALADMSSKPHLNKKPYIPYRDSVLTWLLKDSLGGNSKTIMIATVSPSQVNYGETLSTLRYASRAKNIVNKPVVNEDPNVRLIRELRAEIKKLKSIITKAKLGDYLKEDDESLLTEDIHKKEEQIMELTKTWAGKWKDIQKIIEERNLDLQSEGIKMTLNAECPHLLAIDDDVSGTGIVLYQLKDGETTIGSNSATPLPDIVLSAKDIEERHCVLQNTEGVITLVKRDGKCIVNHTEVPVDAQLSHGSLVQLGEFTVFRFNHPQEAQQLTASFETKRLRFLPLSPGTAQCKIDDQLEEQRLALERDYNLRVLQVREELEQKNKEEKERLSEELDRLRQLHTHTPSSSNEDEPGENDPYNLMQSIAYVPLSPPYSNPSPTSLSSPFSSHTPPPPTSTSHTPTPINSPPPPDISSRVVIGEEAEGETQTQTANQSLSPLTRTPPPTNPSLKQVNGGVVSKESVDSGRLDSGYESENRKVLEGVQECFQSADGGESNQAHVHEYLSRLRQLEDELSKAKEAANQQEQEQQAARKQLGEAQLSKAEEEKRRVDLEASFTQEKDRLQTEQQRLQKQVEDLQTELRRKTLDHSLIDPRRRSYALNKEDFTASGRHRARRRRSCPVRYGTTSLKAEIPSVHLRGTGWQSYHVYQIKVQALDKKWSVYKSYPQFCLFHAEMMGKYPEVSVLSLPPSKWFGFKNAQFVEKRRQDLQKYLQSLLAICTNTPTNPLYSSTGIITKKNMTKFSPFFYSSRDSQVVTPSSSNTSASSPEDDNT